MVAFWPLRAQFDPDDAARLRKEDTPQISWRAGLRSDRLDMADGVLRECPEGVPAAARPRGHHGRHGVLSLRRVLWLAAQLALSPGHSVGAPARSAQGRRRNGLRHPGQAGHHRRRSPGPALRNPLICPGIWLRNRGGHGRGHPGPSVGRFLQTSFHRGAMGKEEPAGQDLVCARTARPLGLAPPCGLNATTGG